MTIKHKHACSSIVGAVALLASSTAWGEVFERTATTDVQLAAEGEVQTPLLQQELVPAGIWIITTQATVRSLGGSARVRCELQTDSGTFDSRSISIGGADEPAVATLNNQAVQTFVNATTVSLVCSREASGAGASVDAQASLLLTSLLSCAAPEPGLCLSEHQKSLNDEETDAFITVIGATYGPECATASLGNQTGSVQSTCEGQSSCAYPLTFQNVGDPAPGCAKSFEVEYHCNDGELSHHASLPAEAAGGVVQLDCAKRVCTQLNPVAPADACLMPPFVGEGDDAVQPWRDPPDSEQGPLGDRCPRAQPYRWCASFGYCWCSAVGR